MLVIEGIGNLLLIPTVPAALWWFLAKCLFITGLVRGWKWVFCLFLVVSVIHVLYFLQSAPFVASANLFLIVLVATAFRFYFPSKGVKA